MDFVKRIVKNARLQTGGFTLLEVLVAVAITGGVLALFLNSVTLMFRSIDNAERKYIALKIAQEGMELMISKRNNNVICLSNPTACDITNWQEHLYHSCSAGPQGYEIFADDPESLLPGETLSVYHQGHYVCLTEGTFDRFTHCNSSSNIEGSPQRRVRSCRIDDEKIEVKSIVTWVDRSGAAKSVTIEKILFNTQP
ncbi:prepilin-type N-terminal cleavage/methylation domain-containing protein [bacterium]|nr:prepilin-type N-terminal cleavage/methylation domain-containing protein [bacterium]